MRLSVAARAGDGRAAAWRNARRGADRRESLVEKRIHGVAGDGIEGRAVSGRYAGDQGIGDPVAIEVGGGLNDAVGLL